MYSMINKSTKNISIEVRKYTNIVTGFSCDGDSGLLELESNQVTPLTLLVDETSIYKTHYRIYSAFSKSPYIDFIYYKDSF